MEKLPFYLNRKNLISRISVPPIQKQLLADVIQNSCF